MKNSRAALTLAAAMSFTCFAQQAAPHTTTISGAVHPELIDDATAYWHLFQTLSRSDGESETTFLRRRLAFAKVTGRPTNQIPQLLAAADKFSADMAMFETQPSALNTVAARSAAVMAIVGDLQKAIGSWSLVLTNYVNNSVKRTIVMIAPMSAP